MKKYTSLIILLFLTAFLHADEEKNRISLSKISKTYDAVFLKIENKSEPGSEKQESAKTTKAFSLIKVYKSGQTDVIEKFTDASGPNMELVDHTINLLYRTDDQIRVCIYELKDEKIIKKDTKMIARVEDGKLFKNKSFETYKHLLK